MIISSKLTVSNRWFGTREFENVRVAAGAADNLGTFTSKLKAELFASAYRT